MDAADGGIPLTDAGRWRSHTTLAYLAQEGLGTVPADIQDELAELVENLPHKRDETWRRKFQVFDLAGAGVGDLQIDFAACAGVGGCSIDSLCVSQMHAESLCGCVQAEASKSYYA